MKECVDCGRAAESNVDDVVLCDDCRNKRNESQDERRHEGDAKHGK
jgi:hypothetical protein